MSQLIKIQLEDDDHVQAKRTAINDYTEIVIINIDQITSIKIIKHGTRKEATIRLAGGTFFTFQGKDVDSLVQSLDLNASHSV